MIRQKVFTATALGALLATGMAQASNQADFFLKGTTARVDGLGRAFVALADDATAIQFNPAGLADQPELNLNTTYSTLRDFDITTNTVNFAGPVKGNQGWGVQVYRNTIGNIIGTTLAGNGRPSVFGTTDEDELGFYAGYGWRVDERLSLGVAIKYLNYKFFTASESGVGFDLGGIYHINPNWRLGLNLQNIGGMDIGPDEVPFNAKVGFAFVDDTQRFRFAVDVDTKIVEESLWHVGMEYRPIPEVAARIGSNDGDLTVGLGLDLGSWALDYSFNDQDLGDLQKITLVYRPRTEKEEDDVPDKSYRKRADAQQEAPAATQDVLSANPAQQ